MGVLCAQHGIDELASRSKLSKASLDQVLKGTLLPAKRTGDRSPKGLGNKAARALEDAFDLPVGWFDTPDQEEQKPTPSTERLTYAHGNFDALTVEEALSGAIRYLANVMASADPMTRDAAAPLLSKLATEPTESERIATMVSALVAAGDHTGNVFKNVGLKARQDKPFGAALPPAPPGGEERRLQAKPVANDRRQEPFVYVGSDMSQTVDPNARKDGAREAKHKPRK